MPNSTSVTQYLPFLRRYARALTGNQASGDAYVAATLEALIADRAVIDDRQGPRVALYRWGLRRFCFRRAVALFCIPDQGH